MLSRDVRRYVDLHRAMGFKFRIQASLLKNFVAFAEGHGDRFIHTSRAIEWAGQAPSAPQRYNRLATVHRCAIALHAEDVHHEVPPDDVFGRQWFTRSVPHIFTPEEIARLIEAARQLTPRNSIRPLTYATLFGLLAATGLRISEALALRLEDLTPDGLVILATKFKKDRLVPLHASTSAALDRYLAARRRVPTVDQALFVSSVGTKIRYPTVITVFLSLARRLGLRAGPGQRGPRLNDMRHSSGNGIIPPAGAESV
ncbi:MAG: tyrosine-type recombinase/integrase [Steroidobacteraceae bacterium]